MNVLPRPGWLSAWISPPSRRAISRLIERPSPVPPNFRLIVPSACWNASKITRRWSGGMPIPVSATENATTWSASFSVRVLNRSSGRGADLQGDLAGRRELHGVGQQVAQHLLEPVLVGEQRAGHVGGHRDGEAEVLLGGERPEGRLDVLHDPGDGHVGGVDVHLPGLHLGQVEDVVDQLEQVGAGAVDGPRELHLPRVEVPLGVLRQQLGQDQQGVERRPQLVRHVREELRLVARRARAARPAPRGRAARPRSPGS